MNNPIQLQKKSQKKRKLLMSLVNDMAQTLRDHHSIQSVKELLEKQAQLADMPPFNPLSKAHALDMLDQLQARISPQYASDLCAQSPWFGSSDKRLTGLGSASMFVPVNAASLAQKHQPFTVQQQLQRITQHSDLFKEQLQRKIDRMTGVRVRTDEWETVFPEDE